MTANDPKIQPAIDEMANGANAARVVSDWTRLLAVEEAERGGELAGALEQLDAPQWGSVVREMFSDLYASPVDQDAPAPEADAPASWVREAVKRVAETPEWAALRAHTAGDEWAAGLGTAELAHALGPVLKDMAPKTDMRAAENSVAMLGEMVREAEEDLEGSDLAGADTIQQQQELSKLQDALADAVNALDAAQVEAADIARALQRRLGSRVRAAAAGAARAAQNEIVMVAEGLRGMGAGVGAGSMVRCAAPPAAVRDMLRHNPYLMQVARMAGRLRAEARRRQTTRTDEAREETSGIESGADVARLLPAEIMHLADPDAELLLMRRLLERSAMQYQLRGTERAARGPLILLLDESGSMEGDRDVWAKAAALALMDVAAAQRRQFALVHFGSSVARVDFVDPSKGISLDAMLDMIGYFNGGGTRLDLALAHGCRMVDVATGAGSAMAKADLVLLTDGEDHHHRQHVLDDMKRKGIGLHVIGLECRIPDDLRLAAETVVQLDRQSMTKDGAIGAVLGMA